MDMKVSRRVIVKDSKGEVIKTYKNTYVAGKAEGVSHETIRRTIMGENTKLKGNGKTYEWGTTGKVNYNNKGDRYNFRKRVVYIKDNGDLKVYPTQSSLARALGVSQAMVNHYVRGKIKTKGFKAYDYDYYVSMWGEPKEAKKEETKEIIKRTTKMLYVNVFVGLANGTLEDGTKYTINGTELTYSKENQALMINGLVAYKRDLMMSEVEVELPLLLEKEKDFLKNLLKAFDNAKGITKCNDIRKGFEFIRIETSIKEDNIALPYFPEGKYYGGLEKNRTYTLDELGL